MWNPKTHTRDQFYTLAELTQRDNPSWRWGQTLFNVLEQVRPDLSEQIRGTDLDPFYWNGGRGVSPSDTDFYRFVHFGVFLKTHWTSTS